MVLAGCLEIPERDLAWSTDASRADIGAPSDAGSGYGDVAAQPESPRPDAGDSSLGSTGADDASGASPDEGTVESPAIDAAHDEAGAPPAVDAETDASADHDEGADPPDGGSDAGAPPDPVAHPFAGCPAALDCIEPTGRVNGCALDAVPPGWSCVPPTGPDGFRMGSADEPYRNDDEVLHRVRLTRAFLVKQTPLTHAEWRCLLGDEVFRPPAFSACGDACPRERVSWREAAAAANLLTARANAAGADLTICYLDPELDRPYELAAARDGLDPRWADRDCTGFRLPTEAEWAYAARAGSEAALPDGEALRVFDCAAPALDAHAWHQANAAPAYPGAGDCECGACGPRPVCTRAANDFGLYDVLGNVQQFVWDGYSPDYQAAGAEPVVDPVFDGEGSFRVLRGCAYCARLDQCRLAYRATSPPNEAHAYAGFRPVRTVE